jgi:hypothetical protein
MGTSAGNSYGETSYGELVMGMNYGEVAGGYGK